MLLKTFSGQNFNSDEIVVVKLFPVFRRIGHCFVTFYEVWVGLTGDRRFLVDRFNNLNDAAKLKKTLKEKN